MYDSHVHYDHKRFDCGRRELLNKMHAEGLDYCINPAIGFESNEGMTKTLDGYDWIYYAMGFHPNCIEESDENDEFYEAEIRRLARHKKVVAIGEAGLDYHRFNFGDDLSYVARIKERQKVWFRKLIRISIDMNLPLILHVREAYEDGLEILDEFPEEKRGVIHCFASNTAVAKEYIKRGFLLGIGGKVTHESETELRECVRELPLKYMLLETDSPYVMPTGGEGKENTSKNMGMIIREIARIKGLGEEEVISATEKNAKQSFCAFSIRNNCKQNGFGI